MKTRTSNDQRKQALSESIWLHYFNHTLFERGLITEAERNRMTIQIDRRRDKVR